MSDFFSRKVSYLGCGLIVQLYVTICVNYTITIEECTKQVTLFYESRNAFKIPILQKIHCSCRTINYMLDGKVSFAGDELYVHVNLLCGIHSLKTIHAKCL